MSPANPALGRCLTPQSTMKVLAFYKGSQLTFKIGLWFMVVSLLFAATIGFWTSIIGMMDFPCEYFGLPSRLLDIQADSRIAYCISQYSRQFGGGGIYANGVSNENKVVLASSRWGFEKITLERQEANILVNGRAIKAFDTFEKSSWIPALNPWLILTTHIVIRNEGLLKEHSQVIYVSGAVTEGWRYNPTGGLIVLAGVGLMTLGVKKSKKAGKS